MSTVTEKRTNKYSLLTLNGEYQERPIGEPLARVSQYLALSMLGADLEELPGVHISCRHYLVSGAQRGKLEITPRPVAGGQQAPGAGAGNQKANAAKLVIIYSIYA